MMRIALTPDARAGTRVAAWLRRARRATGLLAMLIMAAAVTEPSGAGAAEAGVNIAAPTAGQIGQADAVGAHWVRLFVSWRGLEPAKGEMNEALLGSYEQGFEQLPAHTKVILDVVGSPQWETGSGDEHAPPANPQDYATFVAALAQRLAPWVGAYEIWNEEDASMWWTGAPNPAAYAQLLKATYPAVKAADPNAAVLVGGLTGNDYTFLEGLYAAGAKDSFDAVAVHTDTACNVASPYEYLRLPENRIMPDSFLAYREVHSVMVANGDEKPIWMTEMSWRTTSATCFEGVFAGQKPEGVSDEQQATFLREAYHCLAENPYVQVALWYPVQDEGIVTSGLVRADGSDKPSFAAMRAYLRSGDTLNEPCGNFTGPKISVASPANHITYTGPLAIRVSATSDQGVFRIRLEIDGKLIRNYDGKTYPSYLAGAITWQGAKHIAFGRHTLTILAYDKERNVSSVELSINHAKPKPEVKHKLKRKPKKHHSRHPRRAHRRHG
ncbi:MAG TPA: Ig-like domain-containing protein [Acidimicrobiales bacterium]|nr:Ig-like domain-containing protein [Acidimicrobiales bacterium]